MAVDRIGTAGMIAAGAIAGPMTGAQLMLLGKPLGGVLGIPGAVVGYVAVTALILGGGTASFVVWRGISSRIAGGAAVASGIALVVAGTTSVSGVFIAAVLCAGALTGPVLVCGRVLAWGNRGALTGWHTAMAAGLSAGVATAAVCEATPGRGFLGAGVASVLLGVITAAVRYPRAQQDSMETADGPRASWRNLLAYAAAGLLVGGTVLPALHLLLFRWNTLGGEQALLLLPAAAVVVLPGPETGSIAPLLILAAGGPVLVATAPGRVTLAIGIAVTLAAAARAARGLDLNRSGGPLLAGTTLLVTTAAGLVGLGLVSALGHFSGTGTALTLLALPVSGAALAYARTDPARSRQSGTAHSVLEGDVA